MRHPAKTFEKLKAFWAQSGGRPLPVIMAVGLVSLVTYGMFMVLPFFIPGTDKTHFPPYLALPETGFALSTYYPLYAFICLNAMAIFGLYLFALRATGTGKTVSSTDSPANGAGTPRLTHYIVGFALLFHLMMLATPFLLSTDMFDYIRHGRILSVYGENPLVIPATYFPQDPFFTVGGWVGTGSVYGSLHVYIMAMLTSIAGDGFAANFFLVKGFFIGLNIVNLWLVWKVASRISPGLGNRALLFYGWNPFVLILVAANAHNDILMLTLVLAGILMYLDKKVVLGGLFLAMATLVKFISLPILLVYVVLIVRKQTGLLRRVAIGAAVLGLSGVVFVLSYLPLWAGRETFTYLTTVGQKTNFTISSLIRDTAANHIQLSLSNTMVQLSLAALLAAYLLWHLHGVRTTSAFISAAAGLAFLTPLVLFWFQPWYLTLALGLVALRPWRLMLTAALAFSFSVMFFDSFWWHAPVSMDIQKPLRVLIVFGPPVAALIFLKGRETLPRLWKKLLDWSLEQSGAKKAGSGDLSDPTRLRLAVEIGVLFAAAAVPMALVVSTSSQLRHIAELAMLKLRILIG